MQTLSLTSLRATLNDQFEVTPRTLSWYIAEGLVPKPEHEGREGYYDLDKVDIINFVGGLRSMNKDFDFPLRRASRVLFKHQKNLTRLIDLLGGLIEQYPVTLIFGSVPAPDLTGTNARNRAIRDRFFHKLEQATNLDHLSVEDIKDELEREWASQKSAQRRQAASSKA